MYPKEKADDKAKLTSKTQTESAGRIPNRKGRQEEEEENQVGLLSISN